MEITAYHFSDQTQSPAVVSALRDLGRDMDKVLGTRPGNSPAEEIRLTVTLDRKLSPETFVLEVGEDRHISVQGGDPLGAVYGIYEISSRFLDVDPLWFWKDLEPARKSKLDLNPVRVESEPPRFRYRGWFINDEDLLGRWHEPSGKRFTRWPDHPGMWDPSPGKPAPSYEERLVEYYGPVANLETMEEVFEALLRMRGNFIIPASFIDVMEPCETEIIRAAIRRGLYVSQHHVEPMGVSHFAYESWWNAKHGKVPPFSYREAPEAMRECWRTYAAAWAELAGDQLIWQLGLRGRGDRALWAHDPESRDMAGQLISDALAEQMEILKEVDARSAPPATLTLWLEGAELIEQGQLQVPENVTLIFTDHPGTQELQGDFENLPRQAGHSYGLYFHAAVWGMGPHLVQGPMMGKISRAVSRIEQKGDTELAVLNVANLREHLPGVACWHHQLMYPGAEGNETFFSKGVPEEWQSFYQRFFAAVPELRPDCQLYDGSVRNYLNALLYAREQGDEIPDYLKGVFVEDKVQTREKLEKAVQEFDALISLTDAYKPEPRLQAFFDANLRAQLRLLRGLYAAFLAMLSDPPDDAAALAALGLCKEGMALAATGKWRDWYRGDCKVGLDRLMARFRRLAGADA